MNEKVETGLSEGLGYSSSCKVLIEFHLLVEEVVFQDVGGTVLQMLAPHIGRRCSNYLLIPADR